MKRLVALILFILIYPSAFGRIRASGSLAPLAIKGIIDGYYAANVHGTEVINFGKQNGVGEETIGEILKLQKQPMPVKSSWLGSERPKSEKIQLNSPSILIFDSLENFKQTQGRINYQPRKFKRFSHLVYIPGADAKMIESHLTDDDLMDTVNFVVNETPQSIDLITSFLFSPVACYKNQWKIINRFTSERRRWENSDFYPEKYENLHKCELVIGRDPFGTIYSAFESHLNFSLTLSNIVKRQNFSFRYLAPIWLGWEDLYVIDLEPRKILIPPGELYGEYEKMLLPFEASSWIAIVVTIIGGILVVSFIKVFLPKIRSIIFGGKNSFPLINFISIVLNGSQITVLVDNAPRILLLTFMVWSLVVR
jgi:hypothetical protein